MKPFAYWSDKDIPLAHATVKWVLERARDDMKDERICGFLYGVATATNVKGGSRIAYHVNTGGVNACVLDLMLNFAGNLEEMTRKAGPGWFGHLNWRQRAIVWLLIAFAKSLPAK